MPAGLGYDEQGSLATYFALTFLSLALVPSTLWSFRGQGDKAHKKAVNDLPVPEQRRQAQKARLFGRPKRKGRAVSRKTWLLVLGWIVLAGLSYKVATTEVVQNAVYNPFEILGISDTLTDKEIKRAYKRLSLKFHPDKIKVGPNETREDVDNKFVELTKAYKSLTDDAVRENLKLYGNPDGPQQREDIVAIPKWIVEGSNGGWVLAVYGLVFGGLMPWLVGKWWFGTRGHTKDGVLNSTATTFFRRLNDDSSLSDIISILASATEFATSAAELAKSDDPRSKKEAKADLLRREETLRDRARALGLDAKAGVEVMGGSFESAGARKVGMLIWSHLLRVEWDEPTSREELGALVTALPPLLTSLLNISLAHNWLHSTTRIMRLHAFLAQATLPTLPALLQLPHLDVAAARKLEAEVKLLEGRDGGDRWLQAFLALDEKRRRVLVDECCDASVGETEIREMLDVAASWPKLEVVDASFKVIGEKQITPQAIVQVVLKVRLDTVGALSAAGARPAVREVSVGKVSNAPADDEDDETDADKKRKQELLSRKRPVLAHTPFWPEDRPLRFWAMIVDIKSEKIIVQPVVVPTIHPGEEQSFNLQFQAPAGAGLYTFQAVIISNSIACSEIRRGMMLRVDEPAVEVDDDDDISEPDEDSLAGQLAAMKGEKVKSSRTAGGDDESSDESSSDEDDDESSSDEDGPKGKNNNDDSSDSDSD